jgi:hypothetical protein
MRYENDTLTEIRLVSGDVRDATERFVVIGRDPVLREHYQQLTAKPFAKLSAWWMQEFPVQVSRADDRGLNVLATTFRPSDSSRRRPQQINRLQSAVEYPLARMLSLCNAHEVAMAPISCRAPDVVATGMVRIIWDISVAAFLNVSGPFKSTKPTRFTIYCLGDLQPFVDVLDRGHYPCMNHGWLFNTEVQCDRAKRARYLTRRKLKYRRAKEG